MRLLIAKNKTNSFASLSMHSNLESNRKRVKTDHRVLDSQVYNEW